MREHGIDISSREAKHLDTFAGQRFGYVVSLCEGLSFERRGPRRSIVSFGCHNDTY